MTSIFNSVTRLRKDSKLLFIVQGDFIDLLSVLCQSKRYLYIKFFAVLVTHIYIQLT